MAVNSLMNGSWKNVMPDINERLQALENKTMVNAGLSEKESEELRALNKPFPRYGPGVQRGPSHSHLHRLYELNNKIKEGNEKLQQEEAVRLGLVLRVPEINDRLKALEKVANSSNLPALEARLDKIEALVKTIQEKLEKIELAEEKQEDYQDEEPNIKNAYVLLAFVALILAVILQKFLPKIYKEPKYNTHLLLL
jgi:DNA repair exonuclease SbcCD ATPase subunit